MQNSIAYKTFSLEDTSVVALGDLDLELGDELRSFKKGLVDYPKIIVETFTDYYKKLNIKHDGLLFIPSNKNKSIMEFFANEISKYIEVPVFKNIEFRKEIKEQKHLETLNERKNNVIGSFVIKNSDSLKNKKLLIIDDVYASGETLKEVLKEFRKEGINNLEVIVFTFREHIFK